MNFNLHPENLLYFRSYTSKLKGRRYIIHSSRSLNQRPIYISQPHPQSPLKSQSKHLEQPPRIQMICCQLKGVSIYVYML